MRWSEVMNKVAASLAARQLPDAEGDPDNPVSMLTALTGSIPPGLRRRLRLGSPGSLSQNKANNDVEPLIYQNEFPVRLLAVGIVDVAAQAVSGASGQECPRVTAITAIAALSTLRLDPGEEGATLLHVHRRMRAFGSAEWTAALDALARRTAELDELLAAAAGDRRQGWHRVALADRILGEAVAGAVVGGAAQASGVPPREWLFPFHLFCNLGVSAVPARAADAGEGGQPRRAGRGRGERALARLRVQGARRRRRAGLRPAGAVPAGRPRPAGLAAGAAQARQPQRRAVCLHAVGLAAPLARRR
jgi:hypothetical protein